MSKSKHLIWNKRTDFHEKKEYGCIWRHSGGWGNTPCHYRMNSYNELTNREDVYNKDHRQRAKDSGFVSDDLTSNRTHIDMVKTNAGEKSLSGNKKSKFIKKYNESRFLRPLGRLRLDKEAWHVGYTIPEKDLQTLPPKAQAKGCKTNFEIYKDKKQGGYGAWYPYNHNHHHIIPQGAFKDYVIYSGDGRKASKRIKLVVDSKWNINNALNMIMLPQEIAVSYIVGLPAHCPWGAQSHDAYSDSMMEQLKDISELINEAIEEMKDCEETSIKINLKKELDDVSEDLYSKILKMEPGKEIQAV